MVGSRLARPRSLVKWQHSERIPVWDAILLGPGHPSCQKTEFGALKQRMSGWPLVCRHRVSLGTQQQLGKTEEQRCLPGVLGRPQTSEAQSWARGYGGVCVAN